MRDYTFTLLLGNPHSPMLALNQSYLGDGGIPGYIFITWLPDAYTLLRLPAEILAATREFQRSA